MQRRLQQPAEGWWSWRNGPIYGNNAAPDSFLFDETMTEKSDDGAGKLQSFASRG